MKRASACDRFSSSCGDTGSLIERQNPIVTCRTLVSPSPLSMRALCPRSALFNSAVCTAQNKRRASKPLPMFFLFVLQLSPSCLPPISIAMSKVDCLSCPPTDLSTEAPDSLICAEPLPNVPSIISASPYCQKHLLVFLPPRRGLVDSLNKSLLQRANDASVEETASRVWGDMTHHCCPGNMTHYYCPGNMTDCCCLGT